MSSCEKYTELMSMMLDGELSAAQRDELMAHISACEDCKRVYDAFTAISDAFDEDELVDVPENFAADVMAKLPLESPKIIPMRKKSKSWMRYGTVAACFALVVFGVTRLPSVSGGNTSAAAPAAAPSSMVVSESFTDAAVLQAPEAAPRAPSDNFDYVAYTAGSTKESAPLPMPAPEPEEIAPEAAAGILNLDASDVELLMNEVEMLEDEDSGAEEDNKAENLPEFGPILVLEGESADGDVLIVSIYEREDGTRLSVSNLNGVYNMVPGDLSTLVDTAD